MLSLLSLSPLSTASADDRLPCIIETEGVCITDDGIEFRVPPGEERTIRRWFVGDKEVMRERILGNGNITRETWDDKSQSWRDVMWFENTPQATSRGRTGVPHLGSAEWFFHCELTPSGTCYWVEFRLDDQLNGNPEQPEGVTSMGRAWIGSSNNENLVFLGTENNQTLGFLTSDGVSPNYPNTADKRLTIGPGETARVRLPNSDTMLIRSPIYILRIVIGNPKLLLTNLEFTIPLVILFLGIAGFAGILIRRRRRAHS